MDGYFGGCPTCGENHGHFNVGREHWMFRDTHRVRWLYGSNLFTAWTDETDEQRDSEWAARGWYEVVTEQHSDADWERRLAELAAEFNAEHDTT